MPSVTASVSRPDGFTADDTAAICEGRPADAGTWCSARVCGGGMAVLLGSVLQAVGFRENRRSAVIRWR